MSPLSQTSQPDRFFVYGTLCRGQCRQKCWPLPPLEVVPAWAFGTLYDRADYPAMRPGVDRVVGECWRFAPEHIDNVRIALDQVEGTEQPGHPNLYDRVLLDVYRIDCLHARFEHTKPNASNSLGTAWGYHYSIPPEQHGFTRLFATTDTHVRWPMGFPRPDNAAS